MDLGRADLRLVKVGAKAHRIVVVSYTVSELCFVLLLSGLIEDEVLLLKLLLLLGVVREWKEPPESSEGGECKRFNRIVGGFGGSK